MTSPKVDGVLEIADAVPSDSPGALEIGFAIFLLIVCARFIASLIG